MFHCAAQRVEAEQTDGYQEKIGARGLVGKDVGKQPPDLTLQNLVIIEAEQMVQSIISCKLGHQIYHSTAQNYIQH